MRARPQLGGPFSMGLGSVASARGMTGRFTPPRILRPTAGPPRCDAARNGSCARPPGPPRWNCRYQSGTEMRHLSDAVPSRSGRTCHNGSWRGAPGFCTANRLRQPPCSRSCARVACLRSSGPELAVWARRRRKSCSNPGRTTRGAGLTRARAVCDDPLGRRIRRGVAENPHDRALYRS